MIWTSSPSAVLSSHSCWRWVRKGDGHQTGVDRHRGNVGGKLGCYWDAYQGNQAHGGDTRLCRYPTV